MKQHLKYHRSLAAVVATASGLAFAPAARAAEAADVHAEHEEQGEEEFGNNVLTLKLAGLEIVVPGVDEAGPAVGEVAGEGEDDEVLSRVGVEIGFERMLVPGWLEVELSVLFAPGPGGLTLPIDLVLKKPFEFSPSLEGFVGLGLATEWFEAGEQDTAYGAASQLGVYYWVDPHIGIAIEGEYNLLLHPETAHEFVLASGAAFRF